MHESQQRRAARTLAACLYAVVVAIGLASVVMRAQVPDADSARRFDEVLDVYVRDGFVDYRALKASRAPLDRFVASLGSMSLDAASPQEQVAFWVNAYNATVLQTVLDHYPIQRRTNEYPANSVRQIPGAFETATHRMAGRTVSLDQVETTVLPTFHDPRLFFALGRGATGSGRLLSEAYAPDRLERQLAAVSAECASRRQCVQVDSTDNVMRVSSIFSWRREQFVAGYADRASTGFAERSPVERAVLAFIDPRMLSGERDFLVKNSFKMEYLPFDWTLNDLATRAH